MTVKEYLAGLVEAKNTHVEFFRDVFSVEEQEQILWVLANNLNIESISLRYSQLSPDFFIKLCDAIAKHPVVSFIDFGSSPLSKEMLQAVAQIWATKRTLNRLGLARTQMDDEGFAAFVAVLEASQGSRLSLKESAFGLNNLTANSADSLKKLLRLATIDSLDLRGLPQLAPSIPDIVRTLPVEEPIKELILIGNNMTDKTIAELCAAFQERKPSVESLQIGSNKMNDLGFRAVIDLIKSHLAITTLGLASCGVQINTTLIDELAYAMRESPILTGVCIESFVPDKDIYRFFEIGRTTLRQNKARASHQNAYAIQAPEPSNGAYTNGNGVHHQNGKEKRQPPAPPTPILTPPVS